MRLVRRGSCLLKQARTSAQRVAKRLFVLLPKNPRSDAAAGVPFAFYAAYL